MELLRSYKLTIDDRDFCSGNFWISETIILEAESKEKAIELFNIRYQGKRSTIREIRMLPLPRKPKPRSLKECRTCQAQ